MMTSKITLAAAVAVSVLAAPSAFAASLDPQALMAGLNVIVLEDAHAGTVNHIEGTAFVGGNLTSGTFDANRDNMADVDLGPVSGALIVGGDINANINSGGKGAVVVGGAINGTTPSGFAAATGVGTNGSSGVPVAEMAKIFTALSSNLSVLDSATAFMSGDSNNTTIHSGAGVDGIAVLNLDAAQTLALFGNQNTQIHFAVDTGVSLIVNAAGFDVDVMAKVNGNAPTTLVNFHQAITLDFGSGSFNASVLAPFAHMTSPDGGINGTVVAKSLFMKGEIRPFADTSGYSGDLPGGSVPPVPLPGGIALLGGALLAFGALRRRA